MIEEQTYRKLVQDIRDFNRERDWEQFHDPKSLLLALTGEVGELAELFQWIPADDAAVEFSGGRKQERAGEEIGDVLIYLIQLSDKLGLDAVECATRKLEAARHRFPAASFHGNAPVKK